MRRFAAVLASLLFAASLSAANLPQLLQKAKDQFRLAAYKDALATLDQLESESMVPGLEKDREALAPILPFYRAACLASLDRPAEADQMLARLDSLCVFGCTEYRMLNAAIAGYKQGRKPTN